jgi:hypothetical protein
MDTPVIAERRNLAGRTIAMLWMAQNQRENAPTHA